MVRANTIPDALKTREQWICWTTQNRNGKPTKVPVDPVNEDYAKVSDPDTWTAFPSAHIYYQLNDKIEGIGYVFNEDGPYAGVDLDDCRDPDTGTIEEWAFDIILHLDSYTELSPSRTGYHIIVKGSIPDGGNRTGQIEMYDTDRYFTVTGDHVAGTPRMVKERTQELRDLHKEYIADDDDTSDNPIPEPSETTLSDKELIDKAMHASNGEKFRRLWQGDTSNYPSHSEADQALCNLLAFWTGGDEQRIERLFEQSGLVRDKWHDREDYRERTIQNAIRHCSSYYED